MLHPQRRTLRHKLYIVLEGGVRSDLWARLFEGFMVLLIVSNVAAFALETVDEIEARYGPALELFNLVSVGIFTLEYVARLWVAPEHPIYRNDPPFRARLKFACTPFMVVDLIVIIPFILAQIFAIDLRLLRMARLLRFLKLVRYSPALMTIGTVLVSEWRALAGTGVVMAGTLIGSAALLWAVEGDLPGTAFSSLPEAMWWAIATLTTVGYGDVVPVTPVGKLIGAVVMILGLAFFALPIGIIATGFTQEIHRRDFIVNWGLISRIPLFADLQAKEIGEILNLAHARVVAKDTVLAYAGEPADGLYIISAGDVELTADDLHLHFSEGDWFGAGSLVDSSNRVATITTLTKCHLLHVDCDSFGDLTRRLPGLAGRLAEAVGPRRQGADLTAEEMARGRTLDD